MSAATPRLCDHARDRCAEMRVRTRTAKRVWQTRTFTRPDPNRDDRVFATSSQYPRLAIVVERPESDDPLIVTIMWQTPDPFKRTDACPDWCTFGDDPHWHDEIGRFPR